MIYIVAAWTGYRRKEIASLTLASLKLDVEPPHITLDATNSKRRKNEIQALHPEVANRLREWLKVRKPIHDVYLFPLSKRACGYDRATAKMMKYDLAQARKTWIAEATSEEEKQRRIESDYRHYQNEAGLFADFHANRHTFITNLARAGVAPKVAQTLARHSDIRLTMNVYTHTDLAEKAVAVSKLPAPNPQQIAKRESDAATARQQYSSSSGAPTGTLRPVATTGGKNRRKRERRPNALQVSDLSPDGTLSQQEAKVHPNGFEPLTFGSVDRCSIQLSYGCSRGGGLGRGGPSDVAWLPLLLKALASASGAKDALKWLF